MSQEKIKSLEGKAFGELFFLCIDSVLVDVTRLLHGGECEPPF